MRLFFAIASQPKAGVGGSFDSRQVGPFTNRARAENAMIELAKDARNWACITCEARVVYDDEEFDE